jgi:hypothetical protein
VTTLVEIIEPLLSPLTTTGVVVIFVDFVLLQRKDLRNRIVRLAGSGDIPLTTSALDDAAKRLGDHLKEVNQSRQIDLPRTPAADLELLDGQRSLRWLACVPLRIVNRSQLRKDIGTAHVGRSQKTAWNDNFTFRS